MSHPLLHLNEEQQECTHEGAANAHTRGLCVHTRDSECTHKGAVSTPEGAVFEERIHKMAAFLALE